MEPRKLTVQYHDKYSEILQEYEARIRDAEIKHAKKFQAIRDSKLSTRQILPDISVNKLNSANTVPSNNAETENRSQYMPPIFIAIKKKMAEDLTSNPADFEYASNAKGGSEKADAFMDVIKRSFTQTNTNTEYAAAIEHILGAGTIFAQPVTGFLSEKIKMTRTGKDGKPEEYDQSINSGRYLSFYVYHPLTVLIDPNATPHRAQDTAEWIVVTIGKQSQEYIKRKYGVEISVIREPASQYVSGSDTGKTFLVIDGYKKEIEGEAGLSDLGGLMVREYYKNDGKVYTIVEDFYVVNEAWNDSRIVGKIPIIVCPAVLDTESPYGIPLAEELRPSIELVATAINTVVDNSSMKNKLPWITPKGLIDRKSKASFEAGIYNRMNSILEIDLMALKLAPNFSASSMKELFVKPEVQEVTQGSTFQYQEGLNNIWLITGLNPAMLSGRQEKQIRVQSVADMINAASLKSSSQVVKNLDTYFFNPMCRAWQAMFYVYYEDFKNNELRYEDGTPIPIEVIADMKNIRVVNGSYLPADQMNRMQRASFLAGRAQVNQYSIDPGKVEKYMFNAMGFRLEDFLRDPTQMFDQRQIVAIMQLVQELGPEGFMNYMAQMNQQMTDAKAQEQTPNER